MIERSETEEEIAENAISQQESPLDISDTSKVTRLTYKGAETKLGEDHDEDVVLKIKSYNCKLK